MTNYKYTKESKTTLLFMAGIQNEVLRKEMVLSEGSNVKKRMEEKLLLVLQVSFDAYT